METDSFQNSLAFWVTVLGTAVGLFGIIQSHAWLAALGALSALASVGAIVYARRERRRVRLAYVTVEGRNIDCLNLASLRRRLNRSLAIQRAEHTATVRGEDLVVTWRYTGYCRMEGESAIEFSIDADCNVPFDDLACGAFDLVHDPRKEHTIHPILVGTDGNSKKVSVPFLAPLASGERFDVLLRCDLPGCMKAGNEYCTATVSFEQKRILDYSMKLFFERDRPEWVRVNECGPSGTTRLLKELRPVVATPKVSEYLDKAADMSARSARIYIFRRAAVTLKQTTKSAGQKSRALVGVRQS